MQTLPRCGGMRSGREGRAVSDFKGRHFEGEIVLWAVCWYCRYGVSYRDLEQMMDTLLHGSGRKPVELGICGD